MGTNRYLVDASGTDVSNRGLAALYTFGPLGASVIAAIAAGGVAAISTGAAVLLGLLSALAFVTWPILLLVWLLGGAKDLEASTNAVLWAQGGSPVPSCQRVLRRVFRADLRSRALHLLGLHAELSGDFAEAADLFARAEASLPAMGAARPRKYARMVMGAHRAFDLIAAGQLQVGHGVLQQVAYEFLSPTQTGAFDSLLDDSAWGMGALSLNDTLMKIEGGRDPRALLSLAWALCHYARGARDDAMRVLVTERPVLDRGLVPREHALARRIYAELGDAALAGTPAEDAWVATVMRGATGRGALSASPHRA
jgi:hypothetical protein